MGGWEEKPLGPHGSEVLEKQEPFPHWKQKKLFPAAKWNDLEGFQGERGV